MQKSLYATVSALVLAILAFVSAIALWLGGQQKTAYIELGRVFSEFEMSKQYQSKLESVAHTRESIIDSMKLQLTATSRALQSQSKPAQSQINEFIYNKEIYIKKKQQFESDNEELEAQYNAEIMKQLNQYIEDYGEKNGYDYIYGADGSGTLMYARKKLNITDQVIVYVNERYHGNSK